MLSLPVMPISQFTQRRVVTGLDFFVAVLRALEKFAVVVRRLTCHMFIMSVVA